MTPAEPITPEDVVKVLTDPRFFRLDHDLFFKQPYVVTIRRLKYEYEITRHCDPLEALAWAKRMFDTWDKEDTHAHK